MPDNYASHSPTTDPGAFAEALALLPTDVESLSKVTQGLVFHYMADRFRYKWRPTKPRLQEINTRSLEAIIQQLMAHDPAPLTSPRHHKKRLVGCCRDFALIACATLRQHGIPARMRYGFANYLIKNFWVDHVVVEVWQENRWRRFDPQYAGLKKTPFNLFDMSGSPFWSGGKAWQMCRIKAAGPERFGVSPKDRQARGLRFIRERLQLDVAALNKMELLCWDRFGDLSERRKRDLPLLDQLASLSLEEDAKPLRERCVADEPFRLPSEVTCFHPLTGKQIVQLVNG